MCAAGCPRSENIEDREAFADTKSMWHLALLRALRTKKRPHRCGRLKEVREHHILANIDGLSIGLL